MANNKPQNQKTDEKKDEAEKTQVAETQKTEPPASEGEQNPSSAGTDNTDKAAKSEASEEKGSGTAAAKKTVKMVLRHKSHTPHYYRCGLMLTKVFAEYDVPEESVQKLKADKWIEIKGSK